MIDIKLTPKHGNAAHRFPLSGYFGVTPVILTGSAYAKYVEPTQTVPIRAVHLVVRCFEVGEGGRPISRVHEQPLWETKQTLWSPSNGCEEETFPGGCWQAPFRAVIPPEAALKAPSCQMTREWRCGWRVDLVVEHRPIALVGKTMSRSYPLHIYDHRQPAITSLPSPPAGVTVGSGSTATHILVNAPQGVYGPGDNMTVSFSARPEDPSTTVRKLHVVLSRRLEFPDSKREKRPRPFRWTESASSPDDATVASPYRSSSSRLTSLFVRGSSPKRSASVTGPDVGEERDYSQSVVNRLAESVCDLPTPGSNGTIWSSANMALPRRGGRWDLGETLSTDMVNVSFEIRVKVTLKTRKSSSFKEVLSPPVSVTFVGSSAADRKAAQEALAVQLASRVGLTPAESRSSVTSVASYGSSKRKASPPHIAAGHSNGDLYSSRFQASPSSSTSMLNSGYASRSSSTLPHPHQVSSSYMAPSPDAYDAGDEGDSASSPRPESRDSSLHRPSTAGEDAYATPALTVGRSSESPPSDFTLGPSVVGHRILPAEDIDLESTRPLVAGARRISSTASDDEKIQPLRARPRLRAVSNEPPSRPLRSPCRGPLPSLDALGLGLPALPEDARNAPAQASRPIRRPRTAPSYPYSGGPPAFGHGSVSRAPPLPTLSQHHILSHSQQQPHHSHHRSHHSHTAVHGGHPVYGEHHVATVSSEMVSSLSSAVNVTPPSSFFSLTGNPFAPNRAVKH